MSDLTNRQIASILDEIGDYFESNNENRFKIRAYHDGADAVSNAPHSITKRYQEKGKEGLKEIPGIGTNIAAVMEEIIRTGRSTLHDSLRAEVNPEDIFSDIPGIGEELAENLVEQLNVRSLEELERIAVTGELEQVDGFGPKKTEAVREILSAKLSRSRQRRMTGSSGRKEEEAPSVALLLSLDKEYREKASGDELLRIAPKRFNPKQEAWLPLWKTERQGYAFTILFSNTAKAHKRNATREWVVIYFDGRKGSGQNTVVTARRGPLQGRRIVRGRELECHAYYKK